MKKTFFIIIPALFLFVCTLSAQKPKTVQIQTFDTAKYVVEYIPLNVAQANVDAQLVQVDKQIETIEKQIADAVKKRDALLQQKAALEYLQNQLDQAAATPPAPVKSAPEPTPEKTSKKKKN